MDEFYSTKQVARLLGVKTITIRRWILKGLLVAINLGKEYRVSKTDLEKFLQERKSR